MRVISVPAPITVRDPITGQAVKTTDGTEPIWTFRQYAIAAWCNDPRARGERVEQIARLMTVIVPAFEDAHEVRLEDADWERLRPVVESPRLLLQDTLADAQLVPFGLAFLAATSTSEKTAPAPNGTTARKEKRA